MARLFLGAEMRALNRLRCFFRRNILRIFGIRRSISTLGMMLQPQRQMTASRYRSCCIGSKYLASSETYKVATPAREVRLAARIFTSKA